MRVEPKAIFKIHLKHTNPPKKKFIVILSVTEDRAFFGYVLVNSKINANLSTHIQQLQLLLKSDSNNKLLYDSYLDCAQFYDGAVADLLELFLEDDSIRVGEISECVFDQIIRMVNKSRLVTPKQKKLFTDVFR